MAEFVVNIVVNVVVNIVFIVFIVVVIVFIVVVTSYCPVNPFLIRISIVVIVLVSLHQKKIIILPNEIRLLLLRFRISYLIIIIVQY